MAGGAHTNEAVFAAAAMGHSPSFTALRQPLENARRANVSLWRALGAFAEERGLTDLSELTAALTLVEDDGAQVRASLAARAQALRDRELADAQAEAESASERMSVPVVLMMAGFILLIGFPALSRVLSL
jgi:Flp pilus assembly protein TadB